MGNDNGQDIWEVSCPAGRAHFICHNLFTQCLLSRTPWQVDQGQKEAKAWLGGAKWVRQSGAGGHTFRGAVTRVTLAIPVGEVSKNPLTLLRLPHQWEGLQECSRGQLRMFRTFQSP